MNILIQYRLILGGIRISGLSISCAAYKRNRIYVINHIIKALGGFFFGYIYAYLWKSLLKGSPEVNTMVSYVIVNQGLLWITMFLPTGAFLPTKVRDGTIAFYMLRPSGILYQSFFEVLGHAFYSFVFRSLPIFFLGILILGVQLPDIQTVIPFLISMANAFIISFFLTYFVGLWSMYFLDSAGGVSLHYLLTNLLGGSYLPAEYYPGFLKKLMPLLPFAACNYVPTSIYLGKINSTRYILLQFFWIASLWFIASRLTSGKMKKMQIQGG